MELRYNNLFIYYLIVDDQKQGRRQTIKMGKKNNKLKSTLERHKANQAVKQQMKAQEKKSDKGKLSAKPDKIPFREDDTVLLVGEGKFDII